MDRANIIRLGHSDDAIEPEDSSSMADYCRGRFKAISLSPKWRQKGKSDVDIVQGLPLQQPADSNRNVTIFQFCQIEPKTMALVAGDGPRQEITASVIEGSHPLITNEPQKRRVIQKLEDKRCIADRQSTKDQTFGFDNFHDAFCGEHGAQNDGSSYFTVG